jgi:hypothetical protein
VKRLDELPLVPTDDPDDFDWYPIQHHLGFGAFGVNGFGGDRGDVLVAGARRDARAARRSSTWSSRERRASRSNGETSRRAAVSFVAIPDPAVTAAAVPRGRHAPARDRRAGRLRLRYDLESAQLRAGAARRLESPPWRHGARPSRTSSAASGSTAASGETFETTQPATARCSASSRVGAEDVDRAVEAAKRRTRMAARPGAAPRRDPLPLRPLLADRKDELAELMAREMGKVLPEAAATSRKRST